MIWKIRKVVDSTFLFLLVFTKLELIKGTVSVISNALPRKAGKAYKLMKHKSDQKCGR